MRNCIFLIALVFNLPFAIGITCTWTGATDTDWHTASNWDSGTVPTMSDDVVINTPGKPVAIAIGMVGECNNLTKGNFLSAFTIAGLLKIQGNLTYNSGLFTGDVSFIGSNLQVVKGAAPLTLANMTIANTQGVLMDGGGIKLSGTLSLQGNIYTNGRSLEVAAIGGYSANTFVITGDNLGNASSTGGLTLNLNSGSSGFYPVGPNASTYTPVTISNTAGPTEKFTVALLYTSISSDAVKSTWVVSEATAGDNTASLTLQWDQAIEGSTFNRADCGIYKVDGSMLAFTGYTPQPSAATSGGGSSWTQTLSGITEFSEWTVHNQVSVLPITLLQFRVFRPTEKKTRVEWLIDLYSNAAFFEIEKSNDGLSFKSIQKIVAHDGSSYQIDLPLDPILYYYRLKMVDTEGEITYSKVVALDGYAESTDLVQISPNPCIACSLLEVKAMSKDPLVLRFFGTQGQLLLVRQIPAGQLGTSQFISLQSLASGIYFVAASNGQGQTTLHKFILQ